MRFQWGESASARKRSEEAKEEILSTEYESSSDGMLREEEDVSWEGA